MLSEASPQHLAARDQTVMGIGQGESGEETESYPAELAEEAMVLDPVVAIVMRLFAPTSMADKGIAQTQRTTMNDLSHTSRPIESWLGMIWRKCDIVNRTLMGALFHRAESC